MKWIVLNRKYPECSGCISLKLVPENDHEKPSVNVTLHPFDGEADIMELYGTIHSNAHSFIDNHVAFFEKLREIGIKKVTAKMIPKTIKALDSYSTVDIKILDTEFDHESGLELTNIEIIL